MGSVPLLLLIISGSLFITSCVLMLTPPTRGAVGDSMHYSRTELITVFKAVQGMVVLFWKPIAIAQLPDGGRLMEV